MSKRYFPSLNDTEKVILQKIAEQNGFKDYHEWLHRQINSFPKKVKKNFICNKGLLKKQKPISVDPDVEAFYQKLACAHSTTELSVLSKFIIYPAIAKYLMED